MNNYKIEVGVKAKTEGGEGVETLGKQIDSLGKEVDTLSKTIDDVSSFTALQKEMEETGSASQSTQNRIKELHDEIKKQEDAQVHLAASLNTARDSVVSLKKALDDEKEALSGQKKRVDESSAAYKEANNNLKELSKGMQDQGAASQEMNSRYQETKEKVDSLKKSFDEEKAALQAQKQNVGEASDAYKEAQQELKNFAIKTKESGDSQKKLNSEFESAQKEASVLKTRYEQQGQALDSLHTSLKKTGVDTNNLAQEQARLQQSLNETKDSLLKLKQTNEAYSTLGIKSSRDVAEEIQKQRQAYETLKNSGTASFNDLAIGHMAMTRNIKELTSETSLLEKTWKGVKPGIVMATTAIAAGIASIGYASYQAFQKYSEFATGMAEIYTLIDGPREQLDGLEKQIKSLSVTYGMSARELEKAAYDILSSGVALKDVGAVLDLSAKAAAAGLTNISESAAAGVGVLNAYGESVDKLDSVLDTMFQAVVDGKFKFADLAANIGEVLPTARAAEVSFEEVTAALAHMTQAGIKLPQAVTGLKGAITSLAAPAPEAKKVFDELGITWKGLIPTLEQIKQKGLDLNGLRPLIPDVDARDAIMSMKNNFDSLNTILGHINDAAGATQEAFKKISDDPAFEVKQLRAEFELLEISIGKNISTAVLGTVSSLKDLNSEIALNQKDIADLFKAVIEGANWAVKGVNWLVTGFKDLSDISIDFYTSVAGLNEKIKLQALEMKLIMAQISFNSDLVAETRKQIEVSNDYIKVLESIRKQNMDAHIERTRQEEEYRESVKKTLEEEKKKADAAKDKAVKAAEATAEQSAQLLVLAASHAKVNALIDENEKKQAISHTAAIALKTEEDKKYYASIVEQMDKAVKSNEAAYGKDSQQYKDSVEAKKKAQADLYAVYTSEQDRALKSLYDSYQQSYAKIDTLEKNSSVTHLEASRLKSAEDIKYYENKANLLTKGADDALKIYGKDSKEFKASVDEKVQAQKRLFDAQDQEQTMLLKQLERRQLEIDLSVAKEYKSKADGIKEKLKLEEEYDRQAIESAKKRLEQTDEMIKAEVDAHGLANIEILEERKKLVEKIDALENAALKNKLQIVTAEKEEEKKANEESAKAIKAETDAVDENTAAKDKNSKAVEDNAEKKKEAVRISISVSNAQEQEEMTLSKLNSSIEMYQSMMRLKIKPYGIGAEIETLKATKQEYDNLIAAAKDYGWELDASNLTLEEAKTKVDELAAKFMELSEQIAEVQKETDQSIREMNRKNMTPEEVHKDMQAEYNEKMAEAQRLVTEKDYEAASKMYLEAQRLAENLSEEVKSVSGATILTLEETTAAAAELMRKASEGAVEAIRLQRDELGKLQEESDNFSKLNGVKDKTWMTGPKVGYASGGKLPGFGWYDTVPAMLTPGERITNAYSTRVWDSLYPGLMDAMNSTKSESDARKVAGAFALGPVLKFNTGGLVPDWKFNIPSMPSSLLSGSGGSASPSKVVELRISVDGGKAISGQYGDGDAEELIKQLSRARMVS